MNDMNDQVALISGGASGIGLATAKKLIARGASVWIGDIQEAQGETVAADIGAHYLHLDVTQESDWISAVDRIKDQAGKLTQVVNNAGIASLGNLETVTTEVFTKTLQVNLVGVFLGCKVAAPLMTQSGGGSIVNVSSIFGMVSDQYVIAYSASKGGVRAMTKAIALDLNARATGIRVNSIHPGFADTPLVGDALAEFDAGEAEAFALRTVGKTPMGVADPEQIARAIVFLLSEDSNYMTGSELVVDGGYTAV